MISAVSLMDPWDTVLTAQELQHAPVSVEAASALSYIKPWSTKNYTR